MSRRAAGIINEWIAWELQSGGFRLDPDCPRGPGVSWGLEGFAAAYGVPRYELEEVVGDLDAFVLKLVDGEIKPDSTSLRTAPARNKAIAFHQTQGRRNQGTFRILTALRAATSNYPLAQRCCLAALHA